MFYVSTYELKGILIKPLKNDIHAKVVFFIMLVSIRKSTVLLKSSQASPNCPPGQSSVKFKISS